MSKKVEVAIVVGLLVLVAMLNIGCEDGGQEYLESDIVDETDKNNEMTSEEETNDAELSELSEFIANAENMHEASITEYDQITIRGTEPILKFADSDHADWLVKDLNGRLAFQYYSSGWKSNLVLESGGNVGIGIANPANKLDVAGTIRAEEVIVETGWADFVFEKDYRLMPLKAVETYINENGHLPGVPSAESVRADGVSIGHSQTLLMQKIEELTLHAIEQNKKIEDLEKQIETLSSKK
jgi:hypothetical protein